MLKTLVKFQVRAAELRDKAERGATAVEYGIMVALIAAVIIAVVVLIGSKLNIAFTKVENKLPTS